MFKLTSLSTTCPYFFKLTRNNTSWRTFLSESYRCRGAWEKRLESPLLKQIDSRSLFQELDLQFSHFGRASAVDVDIYVNACVAKSAFIEDLETILTLFRLCPDTGFTLPSTHHATLRLLLDAGRTSTLLNVISNPLKFGIFPDHYCCNLIMDKFLKEKNYAAAARVGVSQMLQESYDNTLTNRLAVYSCHMYMKSPNQQWYSSEEINTPPPEPKEVVKVRVRYIRKPYFDDHFDLYDPNLLVGKTLSMFSSKIGASDILCASYLLLGLTFYQKWNQVIELAKSISARRSPIFREAIQLARDYLRTSTAKGETVEQSQVVSTAADGSKSNQKVHEIKEVEEIIMKVDEALQALESCATDDDMVLAMEALVIEAVRQQEEGDIEKQEKLFIKWEEERMAELKRQQEEVKKEEALKRIEEQKKQLAAEEKEIFFFDNEDKLDLLIEKREAQLTQFDWLKEKKKTTQQIKEEADATYIPPEVAKRHGL